MTIVIKLDQVNMLVYKYLLESGLKHTAFSLLNEAHLDKVEVNGQKIGPKMLVGYLEKALLFNQIETHVYKDEHMDCKEPFELTKTHQCKTTDLKKQDLVGKINQYNHDMEAIVNEDDSNLSLVSRYKVVQDEISQISISNKLSMVAIYGKNDEHVSLWKMRIDPETNRSSLTVSGIIDFASLGSKSAEFAKLQWDSSQEYLIIGFLDGKLLFFDSKGEVKNLLRVQENFRSDALTWNPYSSDLLSVLYEDDYIVLNPLQGSVRSHQKERLKTLLWQNSKNYATLSDDDKIKIFEVGSEMCFLNFVADEKTDVIKFSSNGVFLGSLSRPSQTLKVWTMESNNYLFSYSDDFPIIDFIWNNCDEDQAKFFNFIILVFQNSIKYFDIEYGTIKYYIDLEEKSPIISTILYNRDTYLLVTQEDGSVSVYSIFAGANNTKRLCDISSSENLQQLIKWGNMSAIGYSQGDLVIINIKKILT